MGRIKLLLILLCTTPAFAAPALVQSNTCWITSTSGGTCALSSSVTAGNTLVSVMVVGTNNLPTLTSDSQTSQLWVQLGGNHSGFQGMSYYYGPNAVSGTHTVTYANATQPFGVVLMEWSGLDQNYPLDDWVDATANTSSLSLGVNGNSSLVIAMAVEEFGAGGSWSTPSGLSTLSITNLGQINSSPGFNETLAFFSATGVTNGSHSYSSTYTGSNQRTVQMSAIALRPSRSGTPDTHIRQYAEDSHSGTCASQTTCTCTWPSSVLAGSTLVAFPQLFPFNHADNPTYSSQTGGNTWSTASTVNSGAFIGTGLFYAQNVTSGSPTVTFTSSGFTGNQWTCTVMELTNVAASSFDGSASLQNTSGTSITTANITTTGSTDILLTFWAKEFQNDTYLTQSAGWSNPPIYTMNFFAPGSSNSVNDSMGYSYQLVSPSTYSNTITATNNRAFEAGALAFKAVAAPGSSHQPVVQVIGQ